MRIRELERRDVDIWAAMRAELWPHADVAELQQECDDFFVRPRFVNAVFLAEDVSGDILGFVELAMRSTAEGCSGTPVPYVEGWYVRPQAQQRGVGRALIAAAERWAVEQGYNEIASDVALGNQISETAHKSLGFEEVGRAVHFRKALPRG